MQRSVNGAIRKKIPLQKPSWGNNQINNPVGETTKLTIRYLY